MEYRILGGLEVEDRGRPVPLRGPRQRALLVHLLVNANEVVPDERLLEDLWAGERPRSGRAALRVRVSQLRKALADGAEALLTRPPGYVLRVGADDLDVLRFERLLVEGRKALAAGRPDAAAETLRDGLAVWRGPALADVAYDPWAQAEIVRLEELRRTALEERIDADLALARHAELVGELEALVAGEPLRERLRAQLMLALYRSGRQADALAAYRAARAALVQELGIEPGRALQELEGAMLRQDPFLDPPQEPVPAGEPGRPAAASPEAERKIVTVLAADLAGSRALAEESDPERSGALLARIVEVLRDTIDESGGRVEGVAGASLTAVFGAPVAQEDHAERALHAALALRRDVEGRFGTEVSLRIGLDTGEVVVGHLPSGGATLTGAAVLSAVRLASAAEPGSPLVGERTAASARGGFEFGPVPSGGEETGSARPLVRALTLMRTTGLGGLRSVFVGRESELDLLHAAYARVLQEGSPRLVTAMGDAGVGKTRLVRELWHGLAGETPEPLRRRGAACPTGAGRRTGPCGHPPRAARARGDRGARDRAPPPGRARDPRAHARDRRLARPPSSDRPRAPARRVGRPSHPARGRAPRGRARRGPPLGAGAAPRPARARPRRRPGTAPPRGDGTTRAARGPSGLGPPSRRVDRLARAPLGRGGRTHAGGSRTR